MRGVAHAILAFRAFDPQEWPGTVPPTTAAEVRVFSDTICVWVPVQDDGFQVTGFLGVLAFLTLRLAVRGIFVRGAIVRGRHYDDGSLTFSPALVRAYRIGEEEAFYPRVIADTNVTEAQTECARRIIGSANREFVDQIFERSLFESPTVAELTLEGSGLFDAVQISGSLEM